MLAFVLTNRGLLGDMGFDMGYIYIHKIMKRIWKRNGLFLCNHDNYNVGSFLFCCEISNCAFFLENGFCSKKGRIHDDTLQEINVDPEY